MIALKKKKANVHSSSLWRLGTEITFSGCTNYIFSELESQICDCTHKPMFAAALLAVLNRATPKTTPAVTSERKAEEKTLPSAHASYFPGLMRRVMEFASSSGVIEAARVFHIPRKTISRWLKDPPLKLLSGGRCLRGRGLWSVPTKAEELLMDWFKRDRALGESTGRVLFMKALSRRRRRI
jgi:hypothetical protein